MKTLKQAAELTGIKHKTLRQRILRGTLKAVKRGRDWYLSEVQIKKIVEKRGVKNDK